MTTSAIDPSPWNDRASRYGDNYQQAPIRSAFEGFIVADALANRVPNSHCLDVGCGQGHLLKALDRHRCHSKLTGVDSSEGMLIHAINRLDCLNSTDATQIKLTLIHASATSLPVEDGCVDTVVSSTVLHHLTDTDKLMALSEMHRVLAPGGRLLIVDQVNATGFHRNSREFNARMTQFFFPFADDENRDELIDYFTNDFIEHTVAPNEFASMMSQIGFHNVGATMLCEVVGIFRAIK